VHKVPFVLIVVNKKKGAKERKQTQVRAYQRSSSLLQETPKSP
jgi:hypothetical protein